MATKEHSSINNMRELASCVAKKENGKYDIPIGSIREVLSIISDLLLEKDVLAILLANGRRRASKKGKK